MVTVPSEDTFIEYTVVGSTTGPFTFDFPYFAKQDLEIRVDGVKLPTSGFTDTPGTGSATAGYDGGSITLSVAVASVTLTIARNTVAERSSNLTAGNVTGTNINAALNKLTMHEQERQRDAARSVKFPVEEDADFVMADATTRASKFYGFDSNGDMVLYANQATSTLLADIAGLTPTDGNVIVGNGSTWVAETGATARTSLGLGTGDSATFAGLAIGASATFTALLDEDNMSSDSATALASQQSIKAFVTSGTVTLANKTINSAANTITLDLSEISLAGTFAEFDASVLDATLVSTTASQALSNKTIDAGTNTLTGARSEWNTANQHADFSMEGTLAQMFLLPVAGLSDGDRFRAAGRLYYWDSSSTRDAINGFCYAATDNDSNPGRWLYDVQEKPEVVPVGLVVNASGSSAANTTAINNAIAYAGYLVSTVGFLAVEVRIPGGSYYVGESITTPPNGVSIGGTGRFKTEVIAYYQQPDVYAFGDGTTTEFTTVDSVRSVSFAVANERDLVAEYITAVNGVTLPVRQILGTDYTTDWSDAETDPVTVTFSSAPAAASVGAVVSVTKDGSNPLNVEVTGHGLSTGRRVKFIGVSTTTELNGNAYVITKVDNDNFTLNGTDSSTFTAGGSGGSTLIENIRFYDRRNVGVLRTESEQCRIHDLVVENASGVQYGVGVHALEADEPATIVYSGLTGGTFSAGNTITGSPSGQTAVVETDNGADGMTVNSISGTSFQSDTSFSNGSGVSATMVSITAASEGSDDNQIENVQTNTLDSTAGFSIGIDYDGRLKNGLVSVAGVRDNKAHDVFLSGAYLANVRFQNVQSYTGTGYSCQEGSFTPRIAHVIIDGDSTIKSGNINLSGQNLYSVAVNQANGVLISASTVTTLSLTSNAANVVCISANRPTLAGSGTRDIVLFDDQGVYVTDGTNTSSVSKSNITGTGDASLGNDTVRVDASNNRVGINRDPTGQAFEVNGVIESTSGMNVSNAGTPYYALGGGLNNAQFYSSGGNAVIGNFYFAGTMSVYAGNVLAMQWAANQHASQYGNFDVTARSATITGATQANPVVITSTAHGFGNGDVVTIASVSGMTELNGNTYTVANRTANTYELSGINGTGYTEYSSGGTATRQHVYKVNGTQVLGPRQTGWSAATGTVSRSALSASETDPATIAAAVAALITDLTATGVIGS